MNKSFLSENDLCPLCASSQRRPAFVGTDLLHGLPGRYEYVECRICGLIYQMPLPSPEKIASFYPEQYDPYRPTSLKNKNRFEKAVLRDKYGYRHLDSSVPGWLSWCLAPLVLRDAVHFLGNHRLLDVGCGSGRYLQSMRNLGWEVDGVEFNDGAAQTCRQAGLRVFAGELAQAGFADETFAVVTARHVLEHIAEPKAFVAEIFRILQPGGWLVLKTPNSRALARNWFGPKWYPNDAPRHLMLYSPANLRRLAQEQGFIPKRWFTESSPKAILNSWDYVSGNRGKPSRKRRLRRLLARVYVVAAGLDSGRGDEINIIFVKPEKQ
ncbi:MAG TPA: class I SAM-dependent methyltransferase [Proteobacteria bacterium]|nr:class I SAM-dependent methyltransferase [Pseudomonadota bacterium]